MDVVVAFLIGWAARKAQRIGHRIDDHLDQTLDAAGDRVWAVLVGKLGIDPWLDRLRTDAAHGGMVAPEVRSGAERVLNAAAEQDPFFAHEVRTAMAQAMSQAPRPVSVHNVGGNYVGSVVAAGPVTIKQKVVNLAGRHPIPFTALVIVVVAALVWGGYRVVHAISAPGSPSSAESIDVSGANSSRLKPIVGQWIEDANMTHRRRIKVYPDGKATFATSNAACSGTVEVAGENTYRMDLDCGNSKGALDITVAESGETLTFVNWSGTSERYRKENPTDSTSIATSTTSLSTGPAGTSPRGVALSGSLQQV